MATSRVDPHKAAPAPAVVSTHHTAPKKVSPPPTSAPAPAPTGPTGTPLDPATQTQVSTISAAPNSFPIGTDYPGTNESVASTSIFSNGPGNWSGANYVPAFIVGDFNHCGYIVWGTSTPLQTELPTQPDFTDPTCSSLTKGVGGSYLARFIATDTNGDIYSAGGDGAPVTLDLTAPGCDATGNGNVKPWLASNEVGTDSFPLTSSTGLVQAKWRYFTKSSEYLMIHGPAPPNQPGWYFVRSQCAPSLSLSFGISLG